LKSETGQNLFDGDIWYTLNYFTDKTWDPAVNISHPLPDWQLQISLNKMSNGNLEINVPFEKPYSIQLLSLNGKVLQSTDASGNTILQKPNATGVYIVNVMYLSSNAQFKVVF